MIYIINNTNPFRETPNERLHFAGVVHSSTTEFGWFLEGSTYVVRGVKQGTRSPGARWFIKENMAAGPNPRSSPGSSKPQALAKRPSPFGIQGQGLQVLKPEAIPRSQTAPFWLEKATFGIGDPPKQGPLRF